jgi:hypothetical protein
LILFSRIRRNCKNICGLGRAEEEGGISGRRWAGKPVNGRITAEMDALGGGQSVELSEVTGAIELAVPDVASASFSESTVNGGISAEFPSLKVTKNFPIGSNLSGSLGSGSATVKASSVNGEIRFRRNPNARPGPVASPAH